MKTNKGYQEARKELIEEFEKMIENMIRKKKIDLMNDGLKINEWWSSEIFTGQDIDSLIQKLKQEKEKN